MPLRFKEAPSERGRCFRCASRRRRVSDIRLQLTLLTRAYCHLCDEMDRALAPLAAAHGARVVAVDVDTDAALEAVHGDRVPVLFLGAPGDGIELCHYHL